MTSAAPIRARIDAAPRHVRSSLAEHLEGTARLLRSWHERPALERAGRYHAVYGNPEGREPLCSPEGDDLAREIGAEAAHLVRLWSVISRRGLVEAAAAYRTGAARIELPLASDGCVAVGRPEFRDLAHLAAANAIEMESRRRAPRLDWLEPLRPVLREEALAELDRFERASRPVRWWRAARERFAGSPGR